MSSSRAPVRLVGAGLPRTGTSSLRDALGLLLGGPVYHMSEAFAHPEHAATWTAAVRGEPPDWDAFLDGYVAGVDVPFSACWRDLAAAYPDAPVLLSHRGDAQVWLSSVQATVLPRMREMSERSDDDDPMVGMFRALYERLFSDPADPAAVAAHHDRWLAEVRAGVEPERLVEWQPGDGWEPLCRALGVAVPDVDFPHENTRAQFLARAEERATRRDDARDRPR